MKTFSELGLEDNLLMAINDLGFVIPTEIQEKSIPVLINSLKDLVALAQTGTGKTAAFGFPILQQIDIKSRTTQALVLAPTRELCLQITNELQLYGKYCQGLNVAPVYGGASIHDQAKQIKRGAQVIVATPGRMKDMIGRRMIDISKIQFAVLDEADEMLNMGFYRDMVDILSHTPREKSTWLFSATMPKEVALIAREFMHEPIEITVGTKNQGAISVSHEYFVVNGRERYLALKRLVDSIPDIFSVIFCRTKRDTQKIAEKLIGDGYNAAAIHGDLSQNQRDLVMKSFRTKQIQLLVATDVAARGIDVDDITHVINYQLPDELETYTHRSGRTGRAGRLGTSMVLVTRSEMRSIKSLEKQLKKSFQERRLPSGEDICEIQLMALAKNVYHTEINHDIDDYLNDLLTLFEDTSKTDLIKKVFSVEFARFHDYYKSTKPMQSEQDYKSDGERFSGSKDRYFINIGGRDGFTWMSLKDFLRSVLELGRDDIFKVDVLDNFSFFNANEEYRELIRDRFSNFRYEGRTIQVEISVEKKGRKKNDKRKKKGGDRVERFKAHSSRRRKHSKR